LSLPIAVVEAGELTIRNATLEDDSNPGGGMILARGTGRVVLESVTFRNNAKPALLVYDNGSASLADVEIDATPTAAAGLSAPSIALGAENTISPLTPSLSMLRTRIQSSGGHALAVYYYANLDSMIDIQLADSQMTGGANSAILVTGGTAGISPNLRVDMSLTNCQITGNAGNGIIGSLADLQIRSSRIADNMRAGVIIGNSGRVSSLFMRNTELSGNSDDFIRYEPGDIRDCDLGTLADPGMNTFTNVLANRSAVNLASQITCNASGNTWIPNEQGADAAGHYPTSSMTTGPAMGLNFTLVTDAVIAF
jgi:hypothetical protein